MDVTFNLLKTFKYQPMKAIVIKYLKGKSTLAEEKKLYQWLQDDQNHIEIFKEEVTLYMSDDTSNKTVDVQEAFEAFKKEIERKTNKPIALWSFKTYYKYAAAAVLIIALASTYFLRDTIFNNDIEPTTPIIVNNQIEPGVDKATLTLEDGTQVALEKGTAYQTQNATSNGEEIVYKDGRRENRDELVYNTLTIPRGGQFFVTLADGTRVWLNSESQLKYPVSFSDGESRQVDLVYGEAYFEVSPSTEHQGSDFKVFNNQQEVQVLGTEFNVKAYKDETSIYTTLVDGKVSVATSGTNQILAPGQQSVLNLDDQSLKVRTVDVNTEISWKDGMFNFEHKPLKDIMQVLARWYDMDVIFDNAQLQDKRFNGLINKSYSIESILSMLKSSNSINTYEINNKTITLK